MGNTQKENWKEEYINYNTLRRKIKILDKKIKALTSRKKMYEQQQIKAKESNRLYMKEYNKKKLKKK